MGQWVSCFIALETGPSETTPLTAAIQPLKQEVPHCFGKALERWTVVRDAKVVKVTSKFESDPLPN